MLSSYFSLNTVMELLCLITAIYCLYNDKQKIWRLMILLLFATYFGETLGRYIYMNKLVASNHFVYNILLIVQVGVFHTMFAHLYRNYNISKVPLLAGLAILMVKYTYDLYSKSFWIFSQDTYTILSVLIVLYGFIFYYYLLTDDAYIDLKYSPGFWWVSGIMIFCFGSMACNIFEERLQHVTIFGHHPGYYIFRVLNVILYGFWAFSFICRKWLYKNTAPVFPEKSHPTETCI